MQTWWRIPGTPYAAKLSLYAKLNGAIFYHCDPFLPSPNSSELSLRDYARVRLSAAAQANTDVLQSVGRPTLQDLLHYFGADDGDLQWCHAVTAGQRFWIYRDDKFVFVALELRPLHTRVLASLFHTCMSCVDVLLGETDMAGDVDLLTPETHDVISRCVANAKGSILEPLTGIHGGQIRRWFSLRRVWVVVCVLRPSAPANTFHCQ